MKVCIAEKPSVAKEIADILGAKTRNNGFYEGNGYQVTWTFGHLCTLLEPQDYNPNLKYWSIDNLPIIPEKFDIKLIDNKGVKEQFEIIKSLFEKADEIINCGDAGQEGELIQRWVLKLTGVSKPVKRLWISSLTEEAIREGFSKLKNQEDYDRLFYAGSARAIGDWLLGMNATRLYTKRYAPQGQVLSIGRVQTPTLAMIVNRFKEIENFKSENYWELKTIYKKVRFFATQGKFDKQEEAQSELNKVKENEFVIEQFDIKEGKESAPKLFDLTSLQVDCNKKLNLGADETLKIAQNLYERKFLSYPRVDTRYLPEDQYPKIEGILKSLTNYNEIIKPLLGEPIRKSKNVFDDSKVTDHHAIIPTNQQANGLNSMEQSVYEMVVKRFISNFYPDCTVSKTTVIGKSNDVEFKANGRQILEPGWRAVFEAEETDEDKKEEESEDQLMPHFDLGEKGAHEPFLEQKTTHPPKHFTEATLLRAMETAGKQIEDEGLRELMKENGIGRPSTRANIIQTLFKRQYIVKQRKNILPTNTGIQLIDTIKHDMLKSAELTGRWEKNLQDIEKGQYNVKQFLWEMNEFVKEVVTQVKFDSQSSKIETVKVEVISSKNTGRNYCIKCGKGEIIEGSSAYGCSQYKDGCDLRIPKTWEGSSIDLKIADEIFKKGKTKTLTFPIREEKKKGHFNLDKKWLLQFEEQKDEELICPKCKKGDMITGKSAWGCTEYINGCTFKIPFEYASKKITEAQFKSIVLKGRSPLIKGFEHNNQKFDGRIVIDKNGNPSMIKV